jgi:hypothetical protein
MSETKGLTRGDEYVRAFLGKRPYMSKTKDNRDVAYFDVSWGVHNPDDGKFGTWRHCIAYGEYALYVKDCRPGEYLSLAGWIVTNPVIDGNGKILVDSVGKIITKEYLIINSVFIIKRLTDDVRPKQMSLVEQSR